MKKQSMLMVVLAALLVLPASEAFAQSEQDDCKSILNAAQAGRQNAVQRISAVENAVKDQLVSAASCLARFGDTASRSTVNVGGMDVSPIRDAIFSRACSVIQSSTSGVVSQYNQVAGQVGQYSTVAGKVSNGQYDQVAQQVGQSAVKQTAGQISGQGTSFNQPSTWDRISCSLTGRC